MKYYVLLFLGIIQIAKFTHGNVVNRKHWELNAAIQNGKKNEYYQSLGNVLSKLMNKRCLNIFDDGCDNGGLPGSGADEEWITDPGNTPGKRCLPGLGGECGNEGVPGAGGDEEWINDPGSTPGKRCLNMFDDGCDNGGLPGSGKDEEWITDPGNTPGKRCLPGLGGECGNEGVPGAGGDEEWIKDPGSTPGKRCLNMFDDGCDNGGLPGSGKDEEWITDPGNTPGKRCLPGLFGEGCNESGGGDDGSWNSNHDPKDDCRHEVFDDCDDYGKRSSSSGRQRIKYLGLKPGKRSARIDAIREYLQRHPAVLGKRSV